MKRRTDRHLVRPLGLVVRESRMERHIEKALFRNQVKLLSDLIQARKTQSAPLPEMTPRLFSSRLSHHSITIEEKFKYVNNAHHARYFNPVSQTVLNAADRRLENYPLRTVPSSCHRHAEVSNRMKSAHCDVFGPKFCSDCSRIKKRVKSAQDQKLFFPNISIQSKALVAPEKTERILLQHEGNYFSSPSGDSTVYDLSSICKGPDGGGPHVFPENEILDRVRSAKRLQVQQEIERADKEVAPVAPPSSRRNSISQLSQFPQNSDMRITVSFVV
ncbi:uncharacterized protein LOC125677539 isoform X2 [Ostrea edulis]|nr:uncharacterized protein LOC125677539 isoform X2 [Ostrea edulis]XP_048771606.2 uncharacterized protein LOC125677539 isoform X2 [Ostrea edulis]